MNPPLRLLDVAIAVTWITGIAWLIICATQERKENER